MYAGLNTLRKKTCISQFELDKSGIPAHGLDSFHATRPSSIRVEVET